MLLAGLRPRLERRAQVPVLVHPAERLIVLGVEVQSAGLQPVGDGNRADRAAGSRQDAAATPIVSSIRIELDETALVRPSNDGVPRGAGSAGSTTMADSPLESSADASARPTNPPPKMITSARSMRAP